MTRRQCLFLLPAASALAGGQSDANKDWSCPMDPDVRSDKPGVCPRCGMKLVLNVPDRAEFPVQVSQTPAVSKPGQSVVLTIQVLDPETRQPVRRFELVHEKLMHLFLVSENLEFFAHDHPELQKDGSFCLTVRLPFGGMYRLLADFYPQGGLPQLAVSTIFVSGRSRRPRLVPSLGRSKSINVEADLRTEPEQLLAAFESKLFFRLRPAEGLEPYLGTWGHMLVVSEDLIDLLHVHPFLAGGGTVQFNVIFPRPGLYRIWTQFQRQGVVDTVVFTVPVRALS